MRPITCGNRKADQKAERWIIGYRSLLSAATAWPLAERLDLAQSLSETPANSAIAGTGASSLNG